METNRAQWLTNQYPENWSAKVASDALCKIIEGTGKPLDSERCLSVQSPKDGKPPTLMVQYRGNQGQYFANSVTFDQNGQNAIYADFEFLAVGLPS